MKFFPRLPETRLKPLQSGRTTIAPMRSPAAYSSPTILVVDDDRLLRELLALGLRSEGYQVQYAQDGEEGWQLLSKEPFDLLITDNDMPRLCGLDLLRRMRAQDWVKPAILMSGDLPLSAPDFAKVLSPGVSLGKPFSIAELCIKIRELLPSAKKVRQDPIPSYSVSSTW